MEKDHTLRLLITMTIAISLKIFISIDAKEVLINKDDERTTKQVMFVNHIPSDTETCLYK